MRVMAQRLALVGLALCGASATGADITGPCPRAPNAATAPTTAGRLRLVELMNLALCASPQTRGAWAAARAAAARVEVARAAYAPTLDLQAGVQSNNANGTGTANTSAVGLNAGVTLGYLLFDSGARDATLDAARASLLAADWTRSATIQTVLQATASAYHQARASAEALEAARATERAAEADLEAARARLKAGKTTRADLLQALTARSQARLTRTQAEGELASTQGTLANAVGLPADRELPLAVEESQPPLQLEAGVHVLLEQAQVQRPEIAAAQAQLAAARAQARAARAAGQPTLSLSAVGSTARQEGGPNPGSLALGLTLSVPLANGNRYGYAALAAEEQAREQEATLEQLRLDVSLELWKAWQALNTNAQALATAEDLARGAEESHAVAQGRYRAGVGTVTELLSAQSALAQARAQRVQARLALRLARFALARSLGTLDPGLLADVPPVPSR